MNKQQFLEELLDIMQREELLTGNEKLDDIEEWDSMTVLGVMSFFDMEFGISLTAKQMKELKSLQELIDLASTKITD